MREPHHDIRFHSECAIRAMPDDELAEFARNADALCGQLRRQEDSAADPGCRRDYAYAGQRVCRMAMQARDAQRRRAYAAEAAGDEARRLDEWARASRRAAQVRAFAWLRERRFAPAGGAS